MSPVPAPADVASARRAYAAWGAILALAGVACLIVALARGTFRPEDLPPPPPDTVLPEPVAPLGELATVPAEFRWTPGGDDVDLTQIVVFRDGMRPIWTSPPLRHGVSSVEMPSSALVGVPAGEGCTWRVREVARGRPRAVSRLAAFYFARDAEGYGPGENPAFSDRVRD